MNRRMCTAAAVGMAVAVLAWAAPASAQIGGKLGSVLKQAQQVAGDLKITEQEEQDIGAEVSERVRQRYGVVQDPAVHRYVTLVGAVLAQASSRPNLPWKFIVLDTDGVNAFAAPGGYVHITRGALGLMTSEAELAGVLAHEMTHVTEKHAIRAIQKGKLVQMGEQQAKLSRGSALFQRVVDKSTEIVMAGFGRSEEMEADQKGVRLANKVGYAPNGLMNFLVRLTDRNKEASTKQGLFASHPEMQDRVNALKNQIAGEHLASTATLDTRFRSRVSYKTTNVDIAGVEAGAAGLTGKTAPQPKPKKKGFGVAGLLTPSGSEKKSTEVTGSGAARGVDRELDAKGGPVKTIVAVTVTAADLAAFKKEGNLR